MDLISVSALVSLLSKIFNSTTEKAGEQLWESLSSVVRRLFGRRSTSVEAVKRLGERPGDADSIRALAQALVDDSARDPQAAAQLRHWLAGAEQIIATNGHVTNTVHGEVRGNILQARDIHGNITF
ncbi:hypothetical protein GCM10027176_62750 [Actinoallomurus bryophytorum]|uniref:Uncharacterized protein n=1 Tax=Actinoallomurus bryophytorum TaxID=1490222 RepID=A0A543CFC8_9ACTN|nr:hypothetical protein [Actinoallomurus bryophytorum]TQL95799.1 hypothetical protein FB559_1309 [Actinoallomurus bryophytorum]